MTKTPTWQERFEKEFFYHKGHIMDGIMRSGIRQDVLLDFISSIVQETEERVRGEMREEITEK